MNADNFNQTIYDTILKVFPKFTIHAVGKNGVKNIVLFDEPELYQQKARYRIAFTSMIVFDKETPLLGVETIFNTASIPPKDIVGPLPVYMITRKIVVRFENGDEKEYNLDDYDSKLRLIIVLSEQKSQSKKDQIKDLNEKFSGVINPRSEFSYLKDFRICEVENVEPVVKELMDM